MQKEQFLLSQQLFHDTITKLSIVLTLFSSPSALFFLACKAFS